MILKMVDDKNPKDQNGWSFLHETTIKDHAKIVKMIIDLVKNKNPKDCVGSTSLMKLSLQVMQKSSR